MNEFEVGDIVTPNRTIFSNYNEKGVISKSIREDVVMVQFKNNEVSFHIKNITLVKRPEENKMADIELDKVKSANLKEAKKQFDNEKTNAEIEFAKKKYREAVDKVDEIDRQIAVLQEQKKPLNEIIKKFL